MPLVIVLLALLAAAPVRPGGAPALGRPAATHAPAPRPTGTVAGVLRHKGCQSLAAGATVTVIGRDAATVADGVGRFALALPPGTYSLVIGGPNLVPDQRIDDVLVAVGKKRDLGVIEVWPEERPANCGAPPQPAVDEEPVVAITPDTPSLDLPGTGVAPVAPSAEQVWVRAPPGTSLGQFRFHGNPARDDEDALGPPSFAVGPGGSLFVLDALNGRVVRFDARGRPVSAFPVSKLQGAEPLVEADLAVSEDGVFVFTEGDMPTLAQYDAWTGRQLVSVGVPASFKAVDLLFVARQRPIFLMQNGQAVRADLAWGGLHAEGPLPGLPAGELYVHADRVSRWLAAVKLLTADGRVRRSVQLHSRVPVTGVRLVGVNRRGEVVVAVDRAEGRDESAPRAEVLLLEVTLQGHLVGAISVPPGDRRYEFREFALAPDGAVVQMQSDIAEVRFVRWVPPPPSRESIAGEGLVKGRVLENGRPVAAAAVTVARTRTTVAAGPDGIFEMRLPAGTYVVTFRRTAAGSPDAPSAERKVAVAAGATVDLGNVVLTPGGATRRTGSPQPLAAGADRAAAVPPLGTSAEHPSATPASGAERPPASVEPIRPGEIAGPRSPAMRP